MKKEMSYLVLGILLISLVFAANGSPMAKGNMIQTYSSNMGNATEMQNRLKEQNRIRLNDSENCPSNCSCQGAVVQCQFQNGSQMKIQAGKSGNTIIQTKGQNASTKVEFYSSNGTLYIRGKSNSSKAINIMPDQIQERLQLHTNATDLEIELDEEGIYQIQTKKQARLFWMFKVKEKVNAQVDAETGEVLKIRNSWWGFLASDVE